MLNWARILSPLAGVADDEAVLDAGARLAQAFDAELACVFAPADITDLMPWMGEGFMGGVQIAAMESLKAAAAAGEAKVYASVNAHPYARTHVRTLPSPVWAELAMESWLSDVVLFSNNAARGRGPLAEAFQQILADEQRPIIVVRPDLTFDGIVAVAWDGGKEASRAMRTALPLLQLAKSVVILGATAASNRAFEPANLQTFLAARGISSTLDQLPGTGDAAPLLLGAAIEHKASLLVSGAFGHPRLQEFIFGGTTRTLLNSDGPSLFLSH